MAAGGLQSKGISRSETLRKTGCFSGCWVSLAALICALVASGSLEAAADPASPAEAAQIRVTLASASGETLSGEGFVVFQRAASDAPVVVPVKLPGAAITELPAGSHWTLIVDFPGYFAADSVLQVPREALGAPMEVLVTLRPAGTLTGRFTVGEKEKLPTGLEARFEPTREPPPRKQDVPAGVSSCAVSPSGEWRCRVPAGRLDMALHPEGFVPHYLWNLEVKPGEKKTLGARMLVRGASVAGWITREDGTPAEKCRVRMERALGPGAVRDSTLEFLQAVASEVPCQGKGFFQSPALAPGSYLLIAEENGARAEMSPVQVWEGAESRLTMPVVLRRAVDFEVTLSPAVDWLGRPWRIEAQRALDYRTGWEEPPYRTEASLEGRARISKQMPGRFWITVYDQLGNAIFSDSQVELSDPAQPYPINLDLIWVQGTVRLGGEPVAGRLFFGGRSGATRVEMISESGGKSLPLQGPWSVPPSARGPRVEEMGGFRPYGRDSTATSS